MPRLLRNLLFALASAAAVLGGAELVLRALGLPDPGLYAGDLGGVWTLRADLSEREVPFRERGTSFRVRTNGLGYRGGPAPSGALVCLGDSTTFGWGVEEGEAWPARLGSLLGEPTVNAGVPGHSTVQGLATLDTALSLRPRGVILAYLVRDAELAPATDRERAASSRPVAPAFALVRLIRSLRPEPPPPVGGVPRVPAGEYAANVRELVARARAAGARVWVLAFPMVTPPAAHLAALAGSPPDAPVLAPTLPATAFFAEDPIHLTPEGNEQLARWLAGELARTAAP